MPTTPHAVVPTERPHQREASLSTEKPRRFQLRPRLGWIVATCFLTAGAAFNVWWYWRDTRALPDLPTISSWLSHEQYGRALAPLYEHLRRSPHDVDARMMLARALAGHGDLLSCAQQLHKIPFWSPEKPGALYREGQAYLKIDRAMDAETAWLEVLKEDPVHPVEAGLFDDACLALLELYATEDRWDDAYAVIWTAHDHAPPAARGNWLGMRMRSELERIAPKESITRLRRYVAAAPDDREAVRALAGAELALGQRSEAQRHIQACIERWPEDARAWRDYAAMLLEQGELDDFLALLRRVPGSAESESETWFFRGVVCEKAGDWERTAENLRKAIELNPYVSKYHYRLAMALERLGLREQAAAHRKRTKQINDARVQLRGAYFDFLNASEPPESRGRQSATAARRLGSLCETLGWARAAQAWNRLALSL
jgi:tetratricopeptide (TPR) repeat protein